MSDIYSLISEEELDAIHRYINEYAIPDGCDRHYRRSIDHILRIWKQQKEDWLGKIFENQLIYSEPISYHTPEGEVLDAIRDSKPVQDFRDAFYAWVNLQRADFDYMTCVNLRCLLDNNYLVTNVYTGETFSVPDPSRPGKFIKIPTGCKTVRAIHKIYNVYANHINGDFEAFRIALSQALNISSLSGNLCISIHPLDYMTMSDNNCGWDSCMSWQNEGSYRQGTVEMMNSSCVVVAYLTAKEDMDLFGWRSHFSWNNKKWRSLYICSPDFIGNIKGYPYQIPEVDKIVIKRLREMVAKQFPEYKYREIKEYDYDKTDEFFGYDITFDTGYMYNDFGTLTSHYGCVNTNINSKLELNYSGPSECMMCGDVYLDLEHEGLLVCESCYHVERCEECGEADDYLIQTGEGYMVCENCLAEYYSRSFDDNEYYRTDNMAMVYVLPDCLKNNMDKINLHKSYSVPVIYDNYDYDLKDEYSREHFEKKYLKDDCKINVIQSSKPWTPNDYYIFLSDLNDDWASDFDGYCQDQEGYSYLKTLKYNTVFHYEDESFEKELRDWIKNMEV